MTSSGCSRLDRAQLVEQRVVDVVADLGVVEDVVAVVVVRELLLELVARSALRSFALRARRARAGAPGRRPAASRCPARSVRSKCSGVTAMRPAAIAARSVPALVVVLGRVAVDAVLLAAGLLVDERRAGRGRRACRAAATSTPVDPAGGHVDVEQRALGQRHVVDLLHEPRGERGGGVEVEAVAEAEVHLARVGLLGDRDPGEAEDDALQRRGDGARVGDVVAEVGAVVDAGDDQVGGEAVDQPERPRGGRSRPACRRSRSRRCRRRSRSPRPTAGGAW